MERDVFEELKESLEQAAQDWKDNNPAKRVVLEGVLSGKGSYKDLPVEEYKLFMERVESIWESEIHKEGFIRNYQQVVDDCWREWGK